MADERFYHDEAGQLYYRAPGNRYVPVTSEQADIIEQGSAEALIRSAGNTAGQLVVGGGALMERAVNAVLPGDPSGTGAQDWYAEMVADQEARRLGDPGPTLIGQVLGTAPDLMMGGEGIIARGGLRGAATLAAREGALGAARSPDDPLTGAALNIAGAAVLPGAIAAARTGTRAAIAGREAWRATEGGVMARTAAAARGAAMSPMAARFGRTAENVVNRTAQADRVPIGWYRPGSGEAAYAAGAPARAEMGAARRGLSAQAVADPDGGSSINRVLGDGYFNAEQMADRFSFPLSKDQGALLNARDMATFTAARNADDEARVRARTGPGIVDTFMNGPATDFGALGRAQQEAVVKETAAQLGMPAELRMTPEKVGQRMKEISDDIETLLESQPVVSNQGLKMAMGRYMRESHTEEQQAVRLVEKYTQQIQDYGNSRDQVSSRNMAKVRNRVVDEIEAVARNAPDTEAVEALTHLKRELDARLMANWDDEMKADYMDLGRQWSLAKALHKGTDAMSDRGDVQVGKLINALKGEDWMTKTGRRSDEFMTFLRTVAAATMKETADSGTPRGIAEMLASKVASGLPLIGGLM